MHAAATPNDSLLVNLTKNGGKEVYSFLLFKQKSLNSNIQIIMNLNNTKHAEWI